MPLTLVGDYSDSGDEDEKEEWQECFDDSTGYPYFWNVKSNEVSWEKPKGIVITSTKQQKGTPSSSSIKSSSNSSSSSNKVHSKAKSVKNPVVFGPSSEPSTPEAIAVSRIRKFENDLADGIIQNIQKEVPLDWRDGKPSSVLYESNFKWNKLQAIFPSLEAKEKVKGSKNAMALIGGVYGDDEDESNSENESDKIPAPSKKRKISVKMPPSKALTKTLLPVPNAFREHDKNEEESASSTKENRPKSAGSLYKKSIDAIAETLCDKLETLKVASICITPLKLLAVQIDTLFAAWQSGALSSSYLQRTLQDMTKTMSSIESNELAPPGWKTIWDSTSKAYLYENLITGEVQSEKPPLEEEDEDSVIIKDVAGKGTTTSTTKEEPEILQIDIDEELSPSSSSFQPPLPPVEEPQVQPLPPLPPDPPPMENPPLPPSHEVQDMDLDEDETNVVVSSSEKELTVVPSSMDSALSSFYKDLASIDKGSDYSNSPTEGCSPSISPVPSNGENGREDSPSEQELDEKKKRKTKISALTLKKKGVSNLVAKWNNLQEQAKNTK